MKYLKSINISQLDFVDYFNNEYFNNEYLNNFNSIKFLFIGLATYISINYVFHTKKNKSTKVVLDNYLNLGCETYKNLSSFELSEDQLKELKNNMIKETTPVGHIKLSYDYNVSAFIYYSDCDIPYKYLEVVARLFVIKNNCKSIYIDYVEEIIKARDLVKNQNNSQNNNYNKNSIFANFLNKKLPGNSNIYITPEKSNKYIKKGSIKDLEEEERKTEYNKKKESTIKNISYKNFKK